ncbi:MAG: EF-P beta-lysylation protein EpmB [Halofilum sp. (in: g-proteobacteria)]|nr:EF-P beta-lysylation protein EpmB [Halofilum sp. (in: g-proteobacteria)]
MIPASNPQKNAAPWQRELADAVRDPGELLALVGLAPGDPAGAEAAARDFPLRVPRSYVARMRAGDPHDPLLAQVLPRGRERAGAPGYGPDPVGDRDAMMRPGVLHKYHGRVLLVTTGACAIHCRYCFRREFPYAQANPRRDQWDAALDYIASDPSIAEVILSGGDPLSLPDPALADLAARIAAIPHVDTLRLHTRLPVVVPARVDEALCAWLGATRLHAVVVLHANHANELDGDVAAACRRLRATGAMLLNQAVLLAGVNDGVAAQESLGRRLAACGVLPYYLHLLDPVRGAAHFDVAAEPARRLLAGLAGRLPGYLVPRLVREEPGRPGKTPITHGWEDGRDARPTGASSPESGGGRQTP